MSALSCTHDSPTRSSDSLPASADDAGLTSASSSRADAGSPQKRADAGTPSPGRVDASAQTPPSSDAARTVELVPDASTPTVPTVGDASVALPCSTAKLTAGDHSESLTHDGRERRYLVHLPSRAAPAPGWPLVIDFHGYSRTPESQKSASGWDKLGDKEGVIAVYPEGVADSWNVGGCCGTAGTDNVDDVGFIRALIAKLSTEVCVDRRRIYASGVSNGAGIAARMACDAGDLFSGVALVSSDLRTQPCKPARPVTEIAFRGTADTLEPYEGGTVGPPGMTYQSPGAKGSFELFAAIDKCTGMPKQSAKYCETYATCANGVEVTLCTMPDVGHSPYDNALMLDIAQTTWDAFSRVPLQTP